MSDEDAEIESGPSVGSLEAVNRDGASNTGDSKCIHATPEKTSYEGSSFDRTRRQNFANSASYGARQGKGEGDKVGEGEVRSPPTIPRSRTHFNHKADHVLRVECLPDSTVKKLTVVINVSILCGIALLVAGIVIKAVKSTRSFLYDTAVYGLNLGIGSAGLFFLTITCILFFWRVSSANKSNKRWSHRRKRFVQLTGWELGCHLVGLMFYVAPNAYAICSDCTWFDPFVLWCGFIRWTAWNSIFFIFTLQARNHMPVKGRRMDGTLSYSKKDLEQGEVKEEHEDSGPFVQVLRYIDLPFHVHWKMFVLLWVPLEICMLGLTITMQVDTAPISPEICQDEGGYDCAMSTLAVVFGVLVTVMVVVYFLTYTVIIFRVFAWLYKASYTQYRMENLVIRLQLRLRSTAFLFFAVTPIVDFYVRMNSCSSYILSWYGMSPMQLVETFVVIVQALLSSPARPDVLSILQVWLQEFSWSEEDLPRKLKQRASSLPDDSFAVAELNKEPMFCFETAVKLLYWSTLVYYIDSPTCPAWLHEETAMDLFHMDHFETVSSTKLDSKAIIGWREDCVVICFRGTSSMTNVLADLQVWRTKHPKDSTKGAFKSPSMVHSGFLAAYYDQGFNKRLLSKVENILNRCKVPGQDSERVKVYCTGHSLGAALAVLCIFDIVSSSPCPQYFDFHCYTFGAPRVGNHSWVKLYNQTVPSTWQIINEDDTITRAGKLFFLYKHVSNRVLINRRGDLIVRPSFSEYSIRRSPGGSIKDHLLSRYRQSLSTIVNAQFSGKSLGDVDSLLKMIESTPGMKYALDLDGCEKKMSLGKKSYMRSIAKGNIARWNPFRVWRSHGSEEASPTEQNSNEEEGNEEAFIT